MSKISNLAHVHPDAKLGEDVTVEAFAFVDADVEIGTGTLIMSGANIRNGSRIGEYCTISPGAVIAGVPQDLKYKGEETLAIIGDHTMVRECVTVNKGTASKGKTVVGSHCLLMAYCHIAHDCVISDGVIVGNATQLAGEVEVEHHAILSGGTLVHQFTRIGAHAMVQGGTRLGKDIPPFIIAGREPVCFSGVNLIGLKRHGYSNEKINEVQDIYRQVYQSGLNFTDAVKKIEQEMDETPELKLIIDFIKGSPRGIVRGYLG